MLVQISERLAQVVEQRRLKSKLEQDLKQVEQDLQEKSALLDALERQFQKEQVDVEKLERLSLKGLFHSILGSKEEQMDKERQEALAAQLKYQQAKRLVDALQSDQARLEQQLRGLRGVEADYAALVDEKERLLRQSDPQAAARLLDLSEQLARRNAEIREIDEAIAAANTVIAGLEQVIDALKSAEGWGTWDMLGGGFLSTAIKHSRIDEARASVSQVQADMGRFARELADVQRSADVRIDIGQLDTFADFFFDGLIMDWIVQSKIQDSLEQSVRAYESVAGALNHLRRMRADAEQQTRSIGAQRAALIESA